MALTESTGAPDDLDVIDVPAGSWAVFRAAGPYPRTLQDVWAATATVELWLPVEQARLWRAPPQLTIQRLTRATTSARCCSSTSGPFLEVGPETVRAPRLARLGRGVETRTVRPARRLVNGRAGVGDVTLWRRCLDFTGDRRR